MIDATTVILGNTIESYLVFIIVLALGFLIGKALSWLISNFIKKLAAKTETKIDDVLVDVAHGPLVMAVFVGTVAYAGHYLAFSVGGSVFYSGFVRMLVTVTVAWFIIRFLDSVINNYLLPYTEKTESDLDDVLVPLSHTIVKIVVITVAVVMILSDFGYNVTSIVAGLGIGGLAFAFAAQDLIKNFFGGVSILTDKPFKIKDLIKFDNRIGTVTEIGLRTTRVETLDGTTLVVPNAKFTDGIIENITKRRQHRVALTLGLEYSTTSKQLKKAREILQQIVKKHKGTKDESTVFFGGFGASSVDLTFIYFITDLKNIPQVQDDINMAIKEQFEKAKISFAYPTQTVIYKK